MIPTLRHVFATAILVSIASPLPAQDFRAGINGIVRDAQGAVVP